MTLSKLKRWSINYYIDTAETAARAGRGARAAGGGLGEYYCEHETQSPVWLCVGDADAVAGLVGLGGVERAGAKADSVVVARWLDDGVAPNGLSGRGFGVRGVHGFDLTFCAPRVCRCCGCCAVMMWCRKRSLMRTLRRLVRRWSTWRSMPATPVCTTR